MTQTRQLAFGDEGDVIEEIERLRAGCHAHGNWSLAQTCWHLKGAPERYLRPPATLEPTADEAKMQHMLNGLLAAGVMPGGLPAPQGTEPPPRVEDAAVDEFVAALGRLRAYHEPHVAFGGFGPVTTERFRQFVLIHSAHHLGMLAPKA